MSTIRDCFNKQMSQYFLHWHHLCVAHRAKVLGNLKVKMYTVYRGYLGTAFKEWTKYKARKKRSKKIVVVDQFEAEKAELQNEINVVTQKLQTDRVRSTAKGQTRFKKALQRVYLKILKSRFHQWHLSLTNLDDKASTIDYNIVTKMRRRVLRLAFK